MKDIKVQRVWLEELVRFSELARLAQDQDKRGAVATLIGYASSAETILRYAKKD